MKNITRHTGRLNIIERLKNSPSGNPRYRCFLADESGTGLGFVTKPDSCHAYGLTNYRDQIITITVGTHYGTCTLNTIETTKGE